MSLADLRLRGLDVVPCAEILDQMLLRRVDHIPGARISITGLPDRARVDEVGDVGFEFQRFFLQPRRRMRPALQRVAAVVGERAFRIGPAPVVGQPQRQRAVQVPPIPSILVAESGAKPSYLVLICGICGDSRSSPASFESSAVNSNIFG